MYALPFLVALYLKQIPIIILNKYQVRFTLGNLEDFYAHYTAFFQIFIQIFNLKTNMFNFLEVRTLLRTDKDLKMNIIISVIDNF